MDVFKAVEGSNIEFRQFLIEHDPNMVVDGDFRNTLLHLVCDRGSGDKCLILLKKRANPNAVNRQGATPLHCAAAKGHRECVHHLLRYGGDLLALTEKGTSVVTMAKNNKHFELVEEINKNYEELSQLKKTQRKSVVTPIPPISSVIPEKEETFSHSSTTSTPGHGTTRSCEESVPEEIIFGTSQPAGLAEVSVSDVEEVKVFVGSEFWEPFLDQRLELLLTAFEEMQNIQRVMHVQEKVALQRDELFRKEDSVRRRYLQEEYSIRVTLVTWAKQEKKWFSSRKPNTFSMNELISIAPNDSDQSPSFADSSCETEVIRPMLSTSVLEQTISSFTPSTLETWLNVASWDLHNQSHQICSRDSFVSCDITPRQELKQDAEIQSEEQQKSPATEMCTQTTAMMSSDVSIQSVQTELCCYITKQTNIIDVVPVVHGSDMNIQTDDRLTLKDASPLSLCAIETQTESTPHAQQVETHSQTESLTEEVVKKLFVDMDSQTSTMESVPQQIERKTEKLAQLNSGSQTDVFESKSTDSQTSTTESSHQIERKTEKLAQVNSESQTDVFESTIVNETPLVPLILKSCISTDSQTESGQLVTIESDSQTDTHPAAMMTTSLAHHTFPPKGNLGPTYLCPIVSYIDVEMSTAEVQTTSQSTTHLSTSTTQETQTITKTHWSTGCNTAQVYQSDESVFTDAQITTSIGVNTESSIVPQLLFQQPVSLASPSSVQFQDQLSSTRPVALGVPGPRLAPISTHTQHTKHEDSGSYFETLLQYAHATKEVAKPGKLVKASSTVTCSPVTMATMLELNGTDPQEILPAIRDRAMKEERSGRWILRDTSMCSPLTLIQLVQIHREMKNTLEALSTARRLLGLCVDEARFDYECTLKKFANPRFDDKWSRVVLKETIVRTYHELIMCEFCTTGPDKRGFEKNRRVAVRVCEELLGSFHPLVNDLRCQQM